MLVKQKRNWIFLLLLCAIAAHFIVPQWAVKGEFQFHWINENGIDLTDQLDEETIAAIETLMEGALCARWRNPLGGYPVRKDTVVVAGIDDDGLCVATLVGSTGQYVIDDYNLRNGEELLDNVWEILHAE